MKTRVIITSILLGVLGGIFLLRAASDHAADLNNSPIRQAVDLYKALSGGELVVASNVDLAFGTISVSFRAKSQEQALAILRRTIMIQTGVILTEMGDKKISVTFNDRIRRRAEKINE